MSQACAFPLPFRGILSVIRSRVEKRRSSGSLPVAIGEAFAPPPQSGLTWFWFLFPLIEPDCQISRIRLSEKTHAFAHERLAVRCGHWIRHTRTAETPPETAGIPVAARCVYRITTDAAFGGQVDRPHYRLC